MLAAIPYKVPLAHWRARDESGRPIIAFTISLIADVRNRDELAFVMSHEAAHHILGHIARQADNASESARMSFRARKP